jgi:hypothetical protein
MGKLYTAIAGRLNYMDWIEGLIAAIYYGDTQPVRIALPYPESDYWQDNPKITPINMGTVKRLLRSYHIKCYWHGFNEEHIWTHVPRRQARITEYYLHRAGLIPPITMPVIDPRNAAWAANPKHGGKLPPRWDDQPRQPRRRHKQRQASHWF